MKLICRFFPVLVIFSLAYSLSGAGGKPLQHYQVLVQNNIFLPRRNVSRQPQRVYSILKETPLPDPAANIVLTGIVKHGQQYFAFFEDRLKGRTLRVQTGDSLLQGKIQHITLDYVEYAVGETAVKVEIGKTLSNTTPLSSGKSFSPPTSSDSTAQSIPAVSTNTSQSTDTSSLVEQMRRRRLQELGQQ